MNTAKLIKTVFSLSAISAIIYVFAIIIIQL